MIQELKWFKVVDTIDAAFVEVIQNRNPKPDEELKCFVSILSSIAMKIVCGGLGSVRQWTKVTGLVYP